MSCGCFGLSCLTKWVLAWLMAETLAARLVESVGVQLGLRDWWCVVLSVLRRGSQGDGVPAAHALCWSLLRRWLVAAKRSCGLK